MKSLFTIILVLLAVALITHAISQEEGEEPVSAKQKFKGMAKFIDKQGRGFKAILDKDMVAAEENFVDAGEIAEEDENWQGTVEAGYSLSTIGKTDGARKMFDAAKGIVTKAKDWRSMLAVGYAYGSLPPEEGAADEAIEVMQEAEEVASEKKDWRALVEIGKGFREMKNLDLAKSTYSKAAGFLKDAEKKAIDEGNWWEMVEVAKGYIEVNSSKLATATYEKAAGFVEKAGEKEPEKGDWRAMVEIGKGFKELENINLAKSTYVKALDILQKAEIENKEPSEENWQAYVEIGEGFRELKSAELAKSTYAKALNLLEEIKDVEGLDMVARAYDEMGEEEKAREIEELADKAREEEMGLAGGKKIRKKKVRKAPPEGWSPTGKTLADAPKISESSRMILAEKARDKRLEAHEKAMLKAEADREYSYEFESYYYGSGGDFGYRRWDVKSNNKFDVSGWAGNNFGRYRLQKDVYILAD